MTELLAHNARASQASLHGQLEGHGWGGNGRLRRPGKGHAKGPRRDEVVTDINSILRLCAVLDTTDLDRALTRAFTTAIMQAYQADGQEDIARHQDCGNCVAPPCVSLQVKARELGLKQFKSLERRRLTIFVD